MKIITIIIISLLSLSFILFTIPVKKVWLSDNVEYGDLFCNTYDGSCIPTSGHFTAERLTFYELIKYRGHWENYE